MKITNRLSPPTVTFHGAAQSVSGSMHLIESGPYRFLLDCGLFRGPREVSRIRNARFPFDPKTIDAVFLSHAHVDHCGNLPNLFRQGFSGPVYCTPATRDLIAVMLADSARVQQNESYPSIGTTSHSSRYRSHPLFDYGDVEETIANCIGVDLDLPFNVNKDVQIRFLEAGHILGSAIILVNLLDGDREYRITFSGDIGRRGVPYLRDPVALPAADLIICESTYGGKVHDTLDVMAMKMADLVNRTVDRGGKLLIPAFSLGRTHIVLHYLRVWMASGRFPTLPIYIDSPLAHQIDNVCKANQHCLAAEVEQIPCQWIESTDEAVLGLLDQGPCIIIASGGMCEGGRIVQHLKHHIDDPRSSIVLVSYQAPDSLGAQLLRHVPTARFHGRSWNKWIEVAEINGFSGHADQNDFEALLGGAVQGTGQVRLVHGELPRMNALAKQLREMGFANVKAPFENEKIRVSIGDAIECEGVEFP